MENEFITINHVLKYMWQAQTDEDNAEITNTVCVSFVLKKRCFLLVMFYFRSGFCLNSCALAENENRGVALVQLLTFGGHQSMLLSNVK